MQDVIHDAVLANGRWRSLDWLAKAIKAIGLDQRSVCVGYLVGRGVEQVERIELDTPPVFKSITYATVEYARWG